MAVLLLVQWICLDRLLLRDRFAHWYAEKLLNSNGILDENAIKLLPLSIQRSPKPQSSKNSFSLFKIFANTEGVILDKELFIVGFCCFLSELR